MIGVLVSGEGTNLQALLDAGLPIVAVASNKPDVRALERAEAAGVETAVFDASTTTRAARSGTSRWLSGCEDAGVELVVLAGYMHLLRKPFFDHFPGRIVNTHSSLLPEFPGAHPIEDVLAAGVDETGATVHYVDEGIDTGPVIAAERVPVSPDDTVDTLARAHAGCRAPAAARGRERTVRALISVYDKTGLDEFARGLAELGWRLVAAGARPPRSRRSACRSSASRS